MADLSIDFCGIKSPNPFWLASAPPANSGPQIMRAFDAGWGGAVWKTLGDPVTNVTSRFWSQDYGNTRMMGLNTNSERTLWRDRALVEINAAVLYSYDQAGVKIMDHHSASQSFMKFDDLECQAGRSVHARWSWIVPPISGSITPVYHKDWADIEIKPNYIAQSEPWK